MSNMSYCRFENTYNDLRDCAGALEEPNHGKLSASERQARRSLLDLCAAITEAFGGMSDAELDALAPGDEDDEDDEDDEGEE